MRDFLAAFFFRATSLQSRYRQRKIRRDPSAMLCKLHSNSALCMAAHSSSESLPKRLQLCLNTISSLKNH